MLSCSIGFAWVNSGTTYGRRVHPASRGFTNARLVVLGFIQRIAVLGFIRVCVGSLGRARGRWIFSGSRGFTQARLGVVGFIQFSVDSLG